MSKIIQFKRHEISMARRAMMKGLFKARKPGQYRAELKKGIG